jgi:D-amino peptidase
MKIYISADIEGTTGIVNWAETSIDKPDSKYF